MRYEQKKIKETKKNEAKELNKLMVVKQKFRVDIKVHEGHVHLGMAPPVVLKW